MIYDSSTDEFSSPFEQATTVNLEHCQYYCSDVFKGYCTFFSYKVKTSFNSNCNLYDFDPIDFASTCQRVGGSKNDDPMQCIHPSNKCSVSTISKILFKSTNNTRNPSSLNTHRISVIHRRILYIQGKRNRHIVTHCGCRQVLCCMFLQSALLLLCL